MKMRDACMLVWSKSQHEIVTQPLSVKITHYFGLKTVMKLVHNFRYEHLHFTKYMFHQLRLALVLKGSGAKPIMDPVYTYTNPIFFEGGLQSTIIIFAKTNPFLRYVTVR